MSNDEFMQWMAYDRIEPFGEKRADLRSAIIAHAVCSQWSKSKLKVEDFMPDFTEKETVKTDNLKASIMQWARQGSGSNK